MTVIGKKSANNYKKLYEYKKNCCHSLLFYIFLILINSYSIEPDIFVQSTVNRASKILSEDISKEKKIDELKSIAKETVDIKRYRILYSWFEFRKTLKR